MPFRFVPFLPLLIAAPSLAAPVPKGNAEGTLLAVTSDGVVRLLTPDGKELKKLEPKEGDGRPVFARLSPDGKRVAEAHRPDSGRQMARIRLRTFDTDAVQELTEVPHLDRLFWSADGATVYAIGVDVEAANDPNKKRDECWLNRAIDVKTGKARPLGLGGEYRITGLTADGNSFVTLRTCGRRLVGKGEWWLELEIYTTDRTTLKHTKVIGAETEVTPLAAFPDGKRWLVQVESGSKPWVRVYGTADKKLSELADWSDDGVMTRTIRLSPDGKRMAFVRLAGGKGEQRWELVVSDADGRDGKTVFESKPPVTIPVIDWR